MLGGTANGGGGKPREWEADLGKDGEKQGVGGKVGRRRQKRGGGGAATRPQRKQVERPLEFRVVSFCFSWCSVAEKRADESHVHAVVSYSDFDVGCAVICVPGRVWTCLDVFGALIRCRWVVSCRARAFSPARSYDGFSVPCQDTSGQEEKRYAINKQPCV